MCYLNRKQISDWKKGINLAIFFIYVSAFCVAQSADSLNQGLKIGSFGLSLGAVILTESPHAKTADVWLREFNKLAPDNSYINRELDTSGKMMRIRQGGFHFNCFLNLKNNKAKRDFFKNTEHRIGLSYTVKPKFQLGFFITDSLNVDTFYSNTTGYVKIDSNSTGHGYYYLLKGHNLGIDVAEIIYPFKWKILRPYTGISAGINMSFNSLTVAYNPEGDAYWRNRHSGALHISSDAKKEKTRFQPGLSGYASVPLGIGFYRKTKPTWVSVFIEGRFGVKYEKYPSKEYVISPVCFILAGIKFIRN